MSMNILNDISKVYLEQVVDEGKVELKQRNKNEMQRKAGNLGREVVSTPNTKKNAAKRTAAMGRMGKLVSAIASDDEDKRFKRLGQSPAHNEEFVDEGNDGNLANNYPPFDRVTRGDVIAGATGKDQMGGKKKKTRVKIESFSDWRYDLSELMEVIDSKNIKEKKKVEGKIEEAEVDNTERIKINPNIREAIEELGGTLLEMVEIEDADCIFDDLSESEVFLLSDKLIEEVVEEFFFECIQEGYGVEEIENVLVESIEISSALLTEADDIKSNRLEKVKSAVKKVGKGLARGAGYVAGAAVRGARAVGRESSKGYDRGRRGSSGRNSSQASSPQARSPQSDTKETGSKRPGLLGRIGSALKSGLKRAVGAGARAVSKGARNVARRMGNVGNGDDKPTNTQRKPSTYRGAGAGTKERVSSGSYTPPTQKKTKPAQPVSDDPWKGSATAPKPAAKPESKPAATAPQRSRAKPAAKPEPKPAAKPESKPAATAPQRSRAKPAAKAEPVAKEEPAATAVRKRKIDKLGNELLSSIRGKSKPKIVDEDLQPETPQQISAQNLILAAQKRLAAANQSSLKQKNKPIKPLETSEPTD